MAGLNLLIKMDGSQIVEETATSQQAAAAAGISNLDHLWAHIMARSEDRPALVDTTIGSNDDDPSLRHIVDRTLPLTTDTRHDLVSKLLTRAHPPATCLRMTAIVPDHR